jgi:hypothetical protein
MELYGLLPSSQEPSTGPYPEPDQCSPYHTILSKIDFNIIYSPTSRSRVMKGLKVSNIFEETGLQGYKQNWKTHWKECKESVSRLDEQRKCRR